MCKRLNPIGYVARIALVIHCLELSLSESSSWWVTKISVDAVKAATAIIQHFNQQKFIMLGLNANLLGSQQSLNNRMVRFLTMNDLQKWQRENHSYF